MTAVERLSDGGDYQISFQGGGSHLRVHVQGDSSFAATVAYWRSILVEVRARRPATLLLIDELRGPPLTADEWHTLVEATAGQGLDGVRIAHVKPMGLQSVEYCEIYAREAGLDSRVFDNEILADLWLRYGSQ